MARHKERAFTIADAVRGSTPVYGGVAGASGSGKTYSALELATGIQTVVGGDIGLIDTENRRALMYAEFFKFRHIPFAPPFNALSYLDSLRFARSKGVKIVIIDSMSHEHEGEGGHLSMHEAELERLAGDDWKKRERVNMLAWAKPAAERRAFLLELQQTDLHVLCCFRAKDKVAMVKKDGKTEVVPIGWQPIAGDEYVYDMKFLAMLGPNSGGVPDWSQGAAKIAKGLDALFPAGKPLSRETGAKLAAYLQGSKDVMPAAGKTAADAPRKEAPRQEGEQDGASDPPPWSPPGGWPAFNALSQWARWSVEFLGKAKRLEAEAWFSHWSTAYNQLSDKAPYAEVAAKAKKDIDAAHKKAMSR